MFATTANIDVVIYIHHNGRCIYTTSVFTVNMLTMGRGWCPREEVDQVGLGCLLKSSHDEALEKQVCLLGDCANQSLKRKPPNEVGACLVAWDLTVPGMQQ